ncbi:prolyl 3-hydroxylase 1 [Acipenser ruthenus]|uniref:prolyl 3-hydroxylase 1 n=1 Tax=Acipenser ruthenus TaxID=7906 RepID=UPI00274052C3|nr:prolyl 3-hydroxylase 1 [Acipenser ruthenus]
MAATLDNVAPLSRCLPLSPFSFIFILCLLSSLTLNYSFSSPDSLQNTGNSANGQAGLLPPYDGLYLAGVRAYFAEEWEKAVEYLERSLQTRAALDRVKRSCLAGCALDGFGSEAAAGGDSLSDLKFFWTVLRRAECLLFCERNQLEPTARSAVSEDVLADFESRNPYNYLQVAYYKLKKVEKAVSAAHTFFVSNPNHLEMKLNLRNYRKMKGVKEESFTDLESKAHWFQFDAALLSEGQGDFLAAAEHWEECVRETLTAINECRALCEGPYRYHGEESHLTDKRDLYQSTADHFLQVLSCRQSCVSQVATRPGRISAVEDFLPSIFEHLHFTYYKAGRIDKALESVRTFLLFYPADEPMLENLQYYLQTAGGAAGQAVTAREEISAFVNQSLGEKKLLYFGVKNLGITFNDPDLWTPESVIPESILEEWRSEKDKRRSEKGEENKGDQADFIEGGALPLPGVSVSQDSLSLNGSLRSVLDGVLNPEECGAILRLAKAAAASGDGYRGRRSPHTPHEKFDGLTVLRALRLSQEGFVSQLDARLFFDAGERARLLLQSYFNSPSPLYFSFTHLVCRAAVPGEQEGRVDLSHPVHADNCLLEPETRQCWREPPAYIHRDLSAILYLNEDFEGGNFFFSDLDGKTVTAEVSPRCGRLLGFTSGSDNPHGVRAVTRGQRCALALWFTLQETQADQERKEAESIWTEILEEDGRSVGEEGKEERVAESNDPIPQPPRSGRLREGARERRRERVGWRDEL